jgi:drug/metabolite transporter (DMT)-like permease
MSFTDGIVPLAAYGTGTLVNLVVRFLTNYAPAGIDMQILRELLLFSRMILPGIAGFVYLWIMSERIVSVGVSWGWYLLRGVVRYLATTCTYYGISHVQLQVSAGIGLLEPFFVMFLSILLGYEQFSLSKCMWLVMACVLSAFGYYSFVRFEEIAIYPILVLLLANFLAATSAIIAKRMAAQESDLASSTIMSLMVACGSLLTIYCCADSEQLCQLELAGWQIILILLLGVVGGIHTLCFQVAVRLYQPSFISSFQYSKIFFGMLLDWLVFAEQPRWQVVCSSMFVLYALYQITKVGTKKIE